MYTKFIVTTLLVLTAASCSDDKNPAQQYGNTMVQSYKTAQKLDAKLNVQQVRKSIQEYYAANNKYPADLNELSAFCGITLKSDNFDYNPTTGELTEK
ncbi:MAG TPA: hypothetical protein VIX18_05375 [Nitrospirota bacterium]